MNRERGITRAVYLPKGMDDKVEETIRSLGWARSRFYLYALTKTLEDLSVLTTAVHMSEVSKE